MPILNRRLWRMVAAGKGQFAALVTVVMMGVLVYISMTTAYYNLYNSQQTFYQQSRFADYFFSVVKAPQDITNRIETIPGVVAATGRIQKDVSFLRPDGGRGTLRLTSYKLPLGQQLNQPVLLSGRMFTGYSGGNPEVLVDPQFAKGLGLKLGDILDIVAEGKIVHLKIVGIATSPEFIYPMKDASSIIPLPGEFGIAMLPYNQAEQILNLQGQVNQLSLQLVPGTNEYEIKKAVDAILAPYGNLYAYPRDQQLSHVVLKTELTQLKVMSRFLPFLFFSIAAGMQFLLLGRMIRLQRSSIGIMKALGYDNRTITAHYVSYAVLVSFTGAMLGTISGIGLAVLLSDTYAQYFYLPTTIGGINYRAIVYSFMISLGVGASSGLLACRGVIKIQPAESMRAAAPVQGKHILLETIPWLWKRFNSSWKMGMRSIARNKTRFMVMVAGVSASVVLLMLGFFMQDAIDYMMEQHFEKEGRYDYLIHFSSPIRESDLGYWLQWSEVEDLEPILEVPVSVTKADSNGVKSDDDLLQGLGLDGWMQGVFSPSGIQLAIPDNGVLLSAKSSKKLKLVVGDHIKVKSKMDLGPGHTMTLKVVGISQQLMGGGSYVSLQTANRLLGESKLLTGVMVNIHPGQAAAFERRLGDLTSISSIVSRNKAESNFRTLMQSAIFTIICMVIFAGILALAIAYNASLMNFNERKNELGLLRVLGYTNAEIRGVLLKEIGLQSLIGIILGIPLGRWLANYYIATAATTDMYAMPAVIYPRTYILATVSAIVFLIAGFWLITPRLKRLDLVETLKNWD
ncbi:MAG: FtsX-like permease family protein [Syntrophomonadaceae bacterium]|nr:FtsX-like permease family protein [Syntrophomonadaceae bacterium]